MASEATKRELENGYATLSRQEALWDERPSEQLARTISDSNNLLSQLNEKAAEEHEVLLEEADIPGDKAHHLMHVLGYSAMSDRHDDEAEAWEAVADSIQNGDYGQTEAPAVKPLQEESEAPASSLRVSPLGSSLL